MKTNRSAIPLLFLGILLLAGCSTSARVGELKNESRSVELDGKSPVHVKVNFGAGSLTLSGGAQELMEADFTYNVARLKPEVEYADGTLAVSQPENRGLSNPLRITEFRNEWGLRLSKDVPMDLAVDVGAGTSTLELAGLSLTGLDISQGAGMGTIDLSGDWPQDLDITIDAGATELTVLLPRDVGVRIDVDRGPTLLDIHGLIQNGNIYTNDAYGSSEVTMRISISSGIGVIHLLTTGSS